jgi:hypothetical protein
LDCLSVLLSLTYTRPYSTRLTALTVPVSGSRKDDGKIRSRQRHQSFLHPHTDQRYSGVIGLKFCVPYPFQSRPTVQVEVPKSSSAAPPSAFPLLCVVSLFCRLAAISPYIITDAYYDVPAAVMTCFYYYWRKPNHGEAFTRTKTLK